MGIYDREYTRSSGGGRDLFARITGSVVGTVILANVVIWIVQAATADARTGDLGPVANLLTASAAQVFGGLQIWRPVTANFVHDPFGLGHVAFNMLGLFFFGRELERIYGRRDFWALYIGAGTIAVLAELVLLQFTAHATVPCLGASGAVMAIVVLFACHFPKRTVLLYFFVPMPIWLLCALFVLADLSGLGRQNGVANLAHLTGALVGFLYWRYDLRWSRLRGTARRRVPRPKKSRRPRGEVVQFPGRPPGPSPATPAELEEIAEISSRIDRLLAKISAQGQDSLTEEELEFLKENSGKYRS